jgi:glutamine cyclotransferase
VVVIEPETGKILKTINFDSILDHVKTQKNIDVMNGIAWDADGARLIVTGKWWPSYFHVELVKK